LPKKLIEKTNLFIYKELTNVKVIFVVGGPGSGKVLK
jgi:hypothetical protein